MFCLLKITNHERNAENLNFLWFQKMPPEVFYKKSALKTVHKIHRKIPALYSLFNKVRSLKACNFIKKRQQNRYFSVILQTFEEHISKRYLLTVAFMIWNMSDKFSMILSFSSILLYSIANKIHIITLTSSFVGDRKESSSHLSFFSFAKMKLKYVVLCNN